MRSRSELRLACLMDLLGIVTQTRTLQTPTAWLTLFLCSGYGAATFLSGVRASNAGILLGAGTGIGIFFVMEAFENWRQRTGYAMALVLPALSPDHACLPARLRTSGLHGCMPDVDIWGRKCLCWRRHKHRFCFKSRQRLLLTALV